MLTVAKKKTKAQTRRPTEWHYGYNIIIIKCIVFQCLNILVPIHIVGKLRFPKKVIVTLYHVNCDLRSLYRPERYVQTAPMSISR